MRYECVVKIAPTFEPLTLSEAKAQLRLTSGFTADDIYIQQLISVARDRAEYFCGRYFTAQTIAIVYYSGFPGGSITQASIELPYPDLTEILEVKYTSLSGVEAIVPATEYTFNADTKKITPVDAWPFDAIDITVTVITDKPREFDAAKQAILMILTDLYELRTETVMGESIAKNPAVNALLFKYRINMGV